MSMFSQSVEFALQMVATITLARLLTPSDFGVVTMVTTFAFLFSSVGNGFTEAVVQREEVNSILASNLFWINLAAGLLLTITFAASGSVLASFYSNPLVAHIAIGFSLTIVLTSLSVLHLAILRRAMAFKLIAVNNICGRVISIGMSIGLALAGWNYWALVAGPVAQCLSVGIGAWVLCRWIPHPPRRVAGTASMVRFAINVYGYSVLNYIKGNMDNLLVGWYFGSSVLGLYKRAFDLFFLPANQLLTPLTAAAVPALSRMTHERDTYRRYLLHSFSILAFVGMGIGAFLGLAGKDLIIVLLGPAWREAGGIFTFFAPGIAAMFLAPPWGWICLSTGRTSRFVRWGLVQLIVTGLLFVLGLPWGPKGVAAAWSASYWIVTLPAIWYAGRPIQFGIGPVISVVWRYVVAAALALCLCALTIRSLPSLGHTDGLIGGVIRIAALLLIFVIQYVGVAVLLHGGWEPLRQFARLLGDLAPRHKMRQIFSSAEVSTAGN